MSARAPGRPRSAVADAAIVRATLELLAEDGYNALSVEAVARRAGVGKATIYRRHGTRRELVEAAVCHLSSGLAVPQDTGGLRSDFAALARQILSQGAATNALTFIPRMLAEATGDPEMHAIFTENLVAPRRRVLTALLERARERGEVRADVDLEIAVDLIAGPMVYRLVIDGMDASDLALHADAVLVAALEGLRAR